MFALLPLSCSNISWSSDLTSDPLHAAYCLCCAAKLDRVFAKPFLAAFTHDDGITCLARNPRRLNSLLSGACTQQAAGAAGPVLGAAVGRDARGGTRRHNCCCWVGVGSAGVPYRCRTAGSVQPLAVPALLGCPFTLQLCGWQDAFGHPLSSRAALHLWLQAPRTAMCGCGMCRPSAACGAWWGTQGRSRVSA